MSATPKQIGSAAAHAAVQREEERAAAAKVQLDVFAPAPKPRATASEPPKSIDERFEAFHKAHPEILQELEIRIVALVRKGCTRVGVRMVWEAIRYDILLNEGESHYKLNDNFISRYARLLIERTPAWRRVLQTRELRT